MAHREVFVLADEQGDGYHDYLNFKSSQSQGAQPASAGYSDEEYSKPVRCRGKAKVKKSNAARQPEPEYDMSSADRLFKRMALNGQSTEFPDNEEEPSGKLTKIPPKQVADHQKLLLCLQRYAASARFAPMLKDAGLKMTNLESKTVAELKQLQTRVRTVCSSSGGASGMLYQGILVGATGVEKVAPKRLVNLDGFAASLRADPEFEAVAEMLELDMGFASSMTPMQRMAWCLGKNAMIVAAMNAHKKQLLEELIAQQQMQAQNMQSLPAASVATPPVPIDASPPPATAANLTQPVKNGAIPVYDD